MNKTTIQWTDTTWQVTRGCERISPGCGGKVGEGGCYAEKIAGRFSKPNLPFYGFAEMTPNGARWTRKVSPLPANLDEPLRMRAGRKVFVNSMSDLFHKDVPFEFIAAVFGVQAAARRHTFQVLTKRAARMKEWFDWVATQHGGALHFCLLKADEHTGGRASQMWMPPKEWDASTWPLPNVWLGVSAEDQQRLDERAPLLLECPAALRFISAEPLLGSLNFGRHFGLEPGKKWERCLCAEIDESDRPCIVCDGKAGLREARISWVIFGGESGGGARRSYVDNIRHGVQQCRDAGVSPFVKQLGAFVVDRNDACFEGETDGMFDDIPAWPTGVPSDDNPKLLRAIRVDHDINRFREEFQGADCRIRLYDDHGGDIREWPADLRVQEFPT